MTPPTPQQTPSHTPYQRSPSTQSSRSNRSQGSSPSMSSISSLPKPSAKPPSLYHDYKGDVKAQDLFVEAIETHRRRGEKHKVLFPGSDKFEMERMDVWNHDSICTPCLILQPKTTAEVSSCVKGYASGVRKCLSENRKTGSKLGIPRLCVAGGRSSYVSLMEGAIVLDLSRMKRVRVDVEGRTASVQGGARIADLDHELGTHGLMAVSGTYQNVGVVGCILGGGIGYASRKHGLASDNVLSAKIVLADGRVKTCSPAKNEDLYWSLRGGGGGIGVITEVTLRCYPLCNAALLTFDLVASSARVRRNIVGNWAQWIFGNVDGSVDVLNTTSVDGAPKEVFSQLILPTNSSSIACICSSVDPEVIPQSEGRLEQFQDIMNSKSKRRFSFLNKNCDEPALPTCWARVPGLADLKKNKLGATMRVNSNFRMVRYYDELQRVSEDYLSPGNVYFSFKYARSLSEHVTEVLVQATTGGNSPNNESRIFITSAGCAINVKARDATAFDAREMNFVIFIEGRWSDSFRESREKRERKRVIKWVNWVSSQLANCEGVQSTTHPEAARDHLSKSSRSNPPMGHYNFTAKNGARLAEIKRRRDPRNVFSLASRVTWKKPTESTAEDADNRNTGIVSSNAVTAPAMKEGEVYADSCFDNGSPRAAVDRDESRLSSDDSTDETDESAESVHSEESDEESPRLHYMSSQRNLVETPRTNSVRSILTDLESIDEDSPQSPHIRVSMRNLLAHTSIARSAMGVARTNSARSVRSNSSGLESTKSDSDGFPPDELDSAAAASETANFEDEHDVTVDFDDEASEWSLPVNESTVSSTFEGEDSNLSEDLLPNTFNEEHTEKYDDESHTSDGLMYV